MKMLISNKIKEIDALEFNEIIKDYKFLEIDIGAGDGAFVYKKALKNKDIMYIGIDTSAESMYHYSAKSIRKPQKGGLKNVMYVVGNANNLPDILSFTADKIYINLPWGSLRDGIIKGEQGFLDNIKKVSKVNASLEVYISYSDLYEKFEIESRQLPELSIQYLSSRLKEVYRSQGIRIVEISVLDNEELKKLNTKWAKKLAFGKTRKVFYFKCSLQSFV